MFNLKHKLPSFFKGDRDLSLWYIPILLIWMFGPLAEAARIFLRTPDHITLQILFFLPPNPLTLFLDTFVQAVLIGTVFYVALRYLSKWFAFALIPPVGIVAELIWCRGDIAGYAAINSIPQSLVIVFWAVIWLVFLIPPYFITKQWKNVPVMLMVGGILVFLVTQQLVAFFNFSQALGGFFTVILSPLLIVSGIAYWLYKRRYRKRKK